MNTHLRQLLVASTFAIATAGVSAQSTQSAPTTPAMTPKDAPTTQAPTTQPPTTQAQRDYEAAKAACQAERSKKEQQECLRRADNAYDRATGVRGAPVQGASPSGSGASAARQRS
jgi:hypothetical protein